MSDFKPILMNRLTWFHLTISLGYSFITLNFSLLDHNELIYFIGAFSLIFIGTIKMGRVYGGTVSLLFYITHIIIQPAFFYLIIVYLAIPILVNRHKIQSFSKIDLVRNEVWNKTQDIMWVKDVELRYIMINNALENFFNLKRVDIIGKNDYEIFKKETAEFYRNGDFEVIKTKKSFTVYEEVQNENSTNHMMTIKQPLLDKNDELIGVFGISRDVSDLIFVRQKLEESKELIEKIFDYAPDPIFVKNKEGEYTKVNQAFARAHRVPIKELIGKTDFELFDKITAEKFIKVDLEIFRTGERQTNQSTNILAGEMITTITTKGPIHDKHGNIIAVVGVAHDITDYKIIEDKIIESQKMDSVGNLAGGIAHDLNNILSGVLGYSSILLTEEIDEERRSYLENIINATNKATDLIRKLLLFSRKHKDQIVSTSLNTIINDVYHILKPSIRKNISFEFDLNENLKNIDGDPSQINQVVMNLCVNAIEAIGKKGIIRISSNMCQIDEFSKFKVTSLGARPGEFVKVVVEDNGIGISQEIRDKIFDPFYTTKTQGVAKGTGLGLSIVYGVVTNHGGLLSIYSEKGKGTAMSVYFPVGKLAHPKQEEKMEEIDEGSGNILIIDDEPLIQNLLKTILSKLGYKTIVATSGAEGISYYKKYINQIDLIILDLVMPEMDGKEVFSKLLKINKDVKIILSTGFGKDGETEMLLKTGVKAFLPKPYTITDISKILSEVISK